MKNQHIFDKESLNVGECINFYANNGKCYNLLVKSTYISIKPFNDVLFTLLDIIEDNQKYKISDLFYTYSSNTGVWPTYSSTDLNKGALNLLKYLAYRHEDYNHEESLYLVIGKKKSMTKDFANKASSRKEKKEKYPSLRIK